MCTPSSEGMRCEDMRCAHRNTHTHTHHVMVVSKGSCDGGLYTQMPYNSLRGGGTTLLAKNNMHAQNTHNTMQQTTHTHFKQTRHKTSHLTEYMIRTITKATHTAPIAVPTTTPTTSASTEGETSVYTELWSPHLNDTP